MALLKVLGCGLGLAWEGEVLPLDDFPMGEDHGGLPEKKSTNGNFCALRCALQLSTLEQTSESLKSASILPPESCECSRAPILGKGDVPTNLSSHFKTKSCQNRVHALAAFAATPVGDGGHGGPLYPPGEEKEECLVSSYPVASPC